MPCCPAVIDLWAAQDAAPLTFPHPNIDSIPFFIRSAVIDAILQQTDRLPEQILSACFYMIQEIHRKKSRQKTLFQIVFLKKAFVSFMMPLTTSRRTASTLFWSATNFY